MDGPHITLMLLFILSDLLTGMPLNGMHGIEHILFTCKIFLEGIPIGAGTELVTIMTRLFIIGTIMAWAKVGIKDSLVKDIN